jgi:hypothetical protein
MADQELPTRLKSLTPRSAQNAIRPELSAAVIDMLNAILSGFVDETRGSKVKVHENMDSVNIPLLVNGQQFTVKVEIWNGDHQ